MTEVPKTLWPDHTQGMLYYTISQNEKIDDDYRRSLGMSYKEWNDQRRHMICYLVDYHFKDYDRLCAFTNAWLGRMYGDAMFN